MKQAGKNIKKLKAKLWSNFLFNFYYVIFYYVTFY